MPRPIDHPIKGVYMPRPIDHSIKGVYTSHQYHIALRILSSLEKGMNHIRPFTPLITMLVSILVSPTSTFSNPELSHQSPVDTPTTDSARVENRTIGLININININKNVAD